MKKLIPLLAVVCMLSLNGCTSLVSSLTSQMANDLADTILNSNDIDTVREGIPAYLLLIDSFLQRSPDDVDLLIAAATLNGSFSIFANPERAGLLNQKSLDYASQAACLTNEAMCDHASVAYDEFEQRISGLKKKDIEAVYALGVAWAGWIQTHSDDWNAIGQLGRVKLLMEKVIELDETWDNGGAHLFLGGLETLLPATMGGKPEKGRSHFERSLRISDGKYLMTRVVYAEQYARLVFDRELHDRLLQEVIDADPVVPGMTLTNLMAQERARELLADSNEYF